MCGQHECCSSLKPSNCECPLYHDLFSSGLVDVKMFYEKRGTCVFVLTGNKWQLSANLSPMAGNLHTCFYQRVHEYLQVGVELETSIRMAESTATVAYQIDIPKADVTFRGLSLLWSFVSVGSSTVPRLCLSPLVKPLVCVCQL